LIPEVEEPLKICVKRRQDVTLDALRMQRICSAAPLAVFAIAEAVGGYADIRAGFDSRRLHFETCYSMQSWKKHHLPWQHVGSVIEMLWGNNWRSLTPS
jgi:hypothetical protein